MRKKKSHEKRIFLSILLAVGLPKTKKANLMNITSLGFFFPFRHCFSAMICDSLSVKNVSNSLSGKEKKKRKNKYVREKK